MAQPGVEPLDHHFYELVCFSHDGFHFYFKPEGRTTEKAIVSAKGGEHVSVAMIRDLQVMSCSGRKPRSGSLSL